MIRFSPTKLPYCLAMLLLPAAAAAANGQDEEKTPAMKIREVLQQPITLDYSASNLKDLAKHLSDKTGVKFFVDVKVQGLPCLDPSCSFELKADRVSLSGVLRRCLAQQKLTYVVLEDSVALALPKAQAQNYGCPDGAGARAWLADARQDLYRRRDLRTR